MKRQERKMGLIVAVPLILIGIITIIISYRIAYDSLNFVYGSIMGIMSIMGGCMFLPTYHKEDIFGEENCHEN